ncbi:DUF1566 domain-containing protein, partial [bacterium]|nr:DUF1566 domain-containing protein [bacterium]
QQFSTQTTNDLGEFSVNFDASGFVSLQGSGFYFNEVEGALSTSNLTLRAFYKIEDSGKQDAHLNLLTHLTYNRVQMLIKDGKTMEESVTQAESELVKALPIGKDDFVLAEKAINLTLQGDTIENAYLFAVSSVILHIAFTVDESGDAGVQELINKISVDLADDGLLKPEVVAKLRDAQKVPEYFAVGSKLLLVDKIIENLATRFAALGSVAVVPDFNKILDQDFDGIVNADDNCWTVPNPAQDASKCSDVWTDSDTGLTWQNPTIGNPLPIKQITEVFTYCGSLNIGGFDDWYLPSINELRSIVAGCPSLETGGACEVVGPDPASCNSCGVTDKACLRACFDEGCFTSDCLDRAKCRPSSCTNAGGPAEGRYWKAGLYGLLKDEMLSSPYSTFISSTIAPDCMESEELPLGVRWGMDYIEPELDHSLYDTKGIVRCVRGGTPLWQEICPFGTYNAITKKCEYDTGDSADSAPDQDVADTADSAPDQDVADTTPTVSPVIGDGKITFYYAPVGGIDGMVSAEGAFFEGGEPQIMETTATYYWLDYPLSLITCGTHAYTFYITNTKESVVDPLNSAGGVSEFTLSPESGCEIQ